MANAKAALINFCLDPFIQSIRTESVQADGYHVSNLVSTNLQAHIKGFRVEHFIRPPVSLDIHFTVPLHVGYILLELEMMGNRDVRIELSGRTMYPPFRQMAGATVREGGGGAIAMLRNKDFERKHGQVSPSGTNILGSYLKGKLSNCGVTGGTLKYSKALSALLCLQLSVTRVSGAKPVAIKFLEVWGHQSPASSVQDRLAFERAVGGLQIVQPFHSPPSQLGVYSSHHEHGNIPQSSLSGVYSANESISSGSSKVVGGKPVVPHTSSGSLSHRTNFQPSVSNIQSFGECNDGNPMMHCLRNEGIPPGAKPANFLCESRKVIQEGLAADVTEVPGTSREHHHTRQHGCHLNHRRMEETGLMDGLQTAAAIETSEVQHLGLHFLSGNPEKMPASSSGRLGPPGEDNEEALVASSSGCPDTKEVCTDILRQPGFRIPGRAKSSSSSLRLLQQSGGVETTLVPRHSVSLKPTSSTLARQASLSTAASSSSCYSPAIPEKFLDEITCELMVLPMLLPSGHYVDRSTLDRLGNMNATYGREDCDPFTGVHFLEGSQPQFCAELKAEIDRFSLSERTMIDPSLGRTLGTASDILQHLKQHTKGVKRGREGGGGMDNGEVKRPRYNQDAQGSSSNARPSKPLTSISGQDSGNKDATSMAWERKWEPTHEVAVAESLDKALRDLYSS